MTKKVTCLFLYVIDESMVSSVLKKQWKMKKMKKKLFLAKIGKSPLFCN